MCVNKNKKGKMKKLILLAGFVFIQGCAPTSYIVKTPTPSNIAYIDADNVASKKLVVNDSRAEDEKVFSTGVLSAELKMGANPIEPIGYLKKNTELELLARGIPVSIESSEALDIDVQKLYMKNHRLNGFSPFVTFTYLKADIVNGDVKTPVGIFIRRGKVPVWSFDEVIEPTLNEPLSLLIKELSAKVNAAVYKQSISDAEVEVLITKLKSKAKKGSSYLDVYQLGFGNNPSAIPFLKELTSSDDEYKRQAAISSLGILKAVDELELLKSLYANGNSWSDKAMSLKAIGDLGTKEALDFLKEEQQALIKDGKKYWVNDLITLYL